MRHVCWSWYSRYSTYLYVWEWIYTWYSCTDFESRALLSLTLVLVKKRCTHTHARSMHKTPHCNVVMTYVLLLQVCISILSTVLLCSWTTSSNLCTPTCSVTMGHVMTMLKSSNTVLSGSPMSYLSWNSYVLHSVLYTFNCATFATRESIPFTFFHACICKNFKFYCSMSEFCL